MKSRKLATAAFIFAIIFIFNAPNSVKAVELITNGGFETGTLAGWTGAYSGCTDNGSSYGQANAGTTFSPGFGGTTSPFTGTRSLFHGWACGPTLATGVYYSPIGGYTIFQDVTVPAGNSITLKFSERLFTNLAFFGILDWRSQRPSQYRVEIRSTSNVVLATPFQVTAPALTTTDIPWTSHTIPLGNTYAGQTIRLAFVWTIATGLAGPGNVGLDAVSIDALVPSAAGVAVSGRVSNAAGRGISRVNISITDDAGETRYALTNPFGYYRFLDIEAGRTYILSANSKRYQFSQPTQVISPSDNLDGINFIGID
jgi:hypothetical protein